MKQRRSSVIAVSSAYRKDVAANGGPFGGSDSAWLVAAGLVEQAAISNTADPEPLMAEARRTALSIVGEAAMHRMAAREWDGGGVTPVGAMVLLAMTMQDVGALNVAEAVVVNALSMAATLTDIERGRLLALRARIALKAGNIDVADDQYRQVARLGQRLRSDELKARAALGLGTIAQARGNYPRMLMFVRRTARLAQTAHLRRVEQQARLGLMVEAAQHRRYDDALIQAWALFECAAGDQVDEAGSLQSLGQLLLEVGHLDAARLLFNTVLAQTLPARIVLPALGGAALIAARTDDGQALDWLFTQVRQLRRLAVPRHAHASALLECAEAASLAGRFVSAERFRATATRIAEKHGFHELTFRAEALDVHQPLRTWRAPPKLGAQATRVVRSVRAMPATRLPERVRLENVLVPA